MKKKPTPSKSPRNTQPETQSTSPDVLLLQVQEILNNKDKSIADAVTLLQQHADAQQREQLEMPVKTRKDFDDRLRQLIRSYTEGQFDVLEGAARNLFNFVTEHEESDPDAYWAAIPLLYELNDLFKFASGLNESVAKRTTPLYAELRELDVQWAAKNDRVPREERELALEKVLYCACGANELKRSGKTDQAAKMFEWLIKFTGERIEADDLKCYLAKATLNYQLGSLYRILEKHDLAENVFTDTLKLLRKEAQKPPYNANSQLALVRKKAMVVGIGFGLVNYTRGFLRRAENALGTALALTANSTHPIIPSYIELLYGTVLRCRAGSNATKVARAVTSLESARSAFDHGGHKRYAARARWEMALAYNLAKNYDDAQVHLDEVAKHTRETGHPKWRTNVRILQSRQLQGRGNYQDALNEAQVALGIATDYDATLPIVDSHLAIGEVRLALAKEGIAKSDNIQDAIAHFKTAFDVSSESKLQSRGSSLPSNPKIVAVCELRLAQCQALLGEEIAARAHLNSWQLLEAHVEHEWVRELAKTVTEEVKQLSLNFTISADNRDEWDYTKSVASLRQWLLQRALQTGKTYDEAAKLIGVKRATLYQWKADSPKTKRARIRT